jgi:flagellar assembly protein FliH
VTFTAAADRPAAAVFEVSPSAGIPDELLVPARAAAQAAGYAAGWAHGIRAARLVAEAEARTARAETQRLLAEQRARLQQAFRALDEAAAGLEQRAAPSADDAQDAIIAAALEIAEAVVGHTVRTDARRAPAALGRVLALVPSAEDVTVHVAPADYAVLTADGSEPLPGSTARRISLVEDASLAPGDAVARSAATVVDARIDRALARVREVLTA